MEFLLVCIVLTVAIYLGGVAFILITPKNQRIFDGYAISIFVAALPVAFLAWGIAVAHDPLTIEERFLFVLIILVVAACPAASYMLLHYRSFTVDKTAKRRTTSLVISIGIVSILLAFLGVQGACTPMTLAISQYPLLAKPLIHSGIGINTRNSNGITPLGMALGKNDLYLAELLIANGADVNAKYRDNSGKPVKIFRPKSGGWRAENLPEYTLLTAACLRGNHEAMTLLIKNGADINAQDKDGKTPLMYVAWNGPPEIVLRMLEMGADPNAVDKKNRTALSYAQEFEQKYNRLDRKKILDYLLQYGAK